MSLLTHRGLNNILSYVVIAACLYAMAWPFIPQLAWWVEHEAPVISTPLVNEPVSVKQPPKANTLFIPKLDLQEEIYDGVDVSTVDKGVWRRPLSATPNINDNTVMVGHRFTQKGQGVFYHLDKLSVGDSITAYWGNKKYDYRVKEVKTVSAAEISVEAKTNQPVLTLYTCTPLWTAENRLVIIAELTGELL